MSTKTFILSGLLAFLFTQCKEKEAVSPVTKPPVEVNPTDILSKSTPLYAVASPTTTSKGGIVKLDPLNGSVIKTMAFATDPYYEDGLAFDGKLIYYINGRTDGVGINKIITIDAELGGIIDTISTEFPPRMDALAATAKKIYVLDFIGKKIYEVSLESKKITNTITPNFPEDAIGGISYGGKRGTLFVSSFDLNDLNNASKYKIYEIDAKTGTVVKSIAVPIPPFGVAYSEVSKALIVSTGDFMQKSSYVINPDNGKVLGSFSGSYSALASDEAN